MSSSSSSNRRSTAITDHSWESIGAALSEEASHREHCAALEATVLRPQAVPREELVFELDEGCLRRRFHQG